MGIMDLYTFDSEPKVSRASDFCRYDAGAGTAAFQLLEKAGATNEMIDDMSKQEAQQFLMADDDERTEIIKRYEEAKQGTEPVPSITPETAKTLGRAPVQNTLAKD